MKRLILRSIGSAAFVAFVGMNTMLFVQKDSTTGSFSLKSLEAFANPSECVDCDNSTTEECQRVISGNTVYIFYGVKTSC